MRRRNLFGSVAAGIVIVFAMAGCASGETDTDDTSPPDALSEGGITAELIDRAQAEGELVLYHGTGESQTQEWVSAFTDEYGISVVQHRDSSNPLWDRFVQEQRAGQYLTDAIIINNVAQWNSGVEEGWIGHYVPGAGAGHDPEFAEEGYYYPLYVSMQAIGYNTDLVTAEEEAALQAEPLEALTDPVWRGRIAAATPYGSEHTTAMWYIVSDRLSDVYGEEWLQAFAANDPVLYDSSVPMTERLVAGEYAVTFANPDSLLAPPYDNGAPIRWVYPEETVALTWGVGLAENAPHPNAARLFMEWATTAEANESLAAATNGRPTHPDAEDPRTFIGEAWFQESSELWNSWATDETFAADREDFLARWDAHFQ